MLRFRLLMPLAAACLLTACDSSDDPVAECLPQEVIDGPLRADYPTEMVGVAVGDTLANLSFLAPDGSDFTLESVYEKPGNKILMLVTASGWCTACIEEQPKLEALYQEYQCRGLELVVAYFQDEQFAPAEATDAGRWQDRFSLTFPVVADIPFVLGDYYDASQTPMVMLVDAESMEILSIETGYNEAGVRAVLNAYL